MHKNLKEASRWYECAVSNQIQRKEGALYSSYETYTSDDSDEIRKIAQMYRDGEEYEREAFGEEFETMKLNKDTAKAIEYFKLIGDSLAVEASEKFAKKNKKRDFMLK